MHGAYTNARRTRAARTPCALTDWRSDGVSQAMHELDDIIFEKNMALAKHQDELWNSRSEVEVLEKLLHAREQVPASAPAPGPSLGRVEAGSDTRPPRRRARGASACAPVESPARQGLWEACGRPVGGRAWHPRAPDGHVTRVEPRDACGRSAAQHLKKHMELEGQRFGQLKQVMVM